MNYQDIVINSLKDKLLSHSQSYDMFCIKIDPDNLIYVCRFLKENKDLSFDMLTDLTITDWLQWPEAKETRFEQTVHLFSTNKLFRIKIKCNIATQTLILPSLTPLWKNANWLEREAWDMYGIKYSNHPNLKRILLYEEFIGHPLKKDYPIDKRQPINSNQDLNDAQ